MADTVPDMSAVVLAGGQSRRMGRDKRFLLLDAESLLSRVLQVLEPIFPEVLLVAAGPDLELQAFGQRIVTDLIPGCGSLGGVYTGLSAARHRRAFVTACDLPLLNATVVQHLATVQPDADIVIARLATGLQPTHAIYSKACLPALEDMARGGRLKLQKLLQHRQLKTCVIEEAQLRAIDPDLLSFFNVNTPADLEFARKLFAGRSGGTHHGR